MIYNALYSHYTHTVHCTLYTRTKNVMIPWGCDYEFQNAELMYRSTDWIIDVINNHTKEWGVHAQYGTPSEYLRATRADALATGEWALSVASV